MLFDNKEYKLKVSECYFSQYNLSNWAFIIQRPIATGDIGMLIARPFCPDFVYALCI